MLENEGDGIHFAGCDHCTHGEEIETEDFYTAVEEVKEKGWSIRKTEEGDWEHLCPECAKKEVSFATFRKKMGGGA